MNSPAIVSLSCGCFFSGRKLIADPDCTNPACIMVEEIDADEDAADDWSCSNCGETAMDGSGICITCGQEDAEEDECECCGRTLPLDELDSKPTINSKLRRIRAREGQLVMLRRAADLGFDFNRLECARCYGPGFEVANNGKHWRT